MLDIQKPLGQGNKSHYEKWLRLYFDKRLYAGPN
jgi:hypothetical protein